MFNELVNILTERAKVKYFSTEFTLPLMLAHFSFSFAHFLQVSFLVSLERIVVLVDGEADAEVGDINTSTDIVNGSIYLQTCQVQKTQEDNTTGKRRGCQVMEDISAAK